jgi:hypothetical protein
MPKRKSGLGPNWKGFDSYLTEEFKSSVSTSGPLDPQHFDVRDEPTTADRQHAGSASYSFAIDREKNRQELGADEEQPSGYIPPQHNGVDFNSTRVEWYRYVPNDPNDMTDAGLGTIFMRFIKRGDQYRYDSVPMGVYAAMSGEGASRGKFVNSTLNHYPYSKIGKDDAAGLFFAG